MNPNIGEVNVHQVFCKRHLRNMKQVYQLGLDLSHKLHQIEAFNTCNDDVASEKGYQQYCESLYSKPNQFILWNQA